MIFTFSQFPVKCSQRQPGAAVFVVEFHCFTNISFESGKFWESLSNVLPKSGFVPEPQPIVSSRDLLQSSLPTVVEL